MRGGSAIGEGVPMDGKILGCRLGVGGLPVPGVDEPVALGSGVPSFLLTVHADGSSASNEIEL